MGEPAAEVVVDLDGHAVVLPYSSGTTGLPKGVRLSHANLVANVAQMAALEAVVPGERTLAVLPFFHIYAMTVLMGYFLGGGRDAGDGAALRPRAGAAARSRPTDAAAFVVPPIVLALAKHPMVADFDLSSVESISAAPPARA